MSLLRNYFARIDLLKLQRPTFILRRQIHRSNHPCVTNLHTPRASASHCAPRSSNLLGVDRIAFTQLRFCSSTVDIRNQPEVKKWEYKIDPFGKLILSSTSLDCSVSPIDPNDYPEQDLVIVSLHGSEGTENAVSCDQLGDDIHLSQTGAIEGAGCIDIKVPIKFDIAANLSGQSNLNLTTLENENISVVMESGTCTLRDIKCGAIKMTSKSGDIISEKTLHGNATFRTGKQGRIQLHKPVGTDLCLETESGDINVTSLYAAKSYFNTRRGNVTIGACHKETMVNMQQVGNLSIATLDGSLLASVGHGDVDVHITKHNSVQVLVSKGNINFKMANPEEESTVELRANTVEIADEIGRTLKEQDGQEQSFLSGSIGQARPASITDTAVPTLIATTGDGSINISKQDWKDTLKLKYNIQD